MLTQMAYGEQTSLSWRKQRAGQRLVVGFPGTSAPSELKALCRQTAPGGFILFGHNVEEPAQVRELNRELRSLVPEAAPPLISVDQEGGRVRRIKETDWPPMRWVGNTGDFKLTEQLGQLMGEELAALGFNLDFAPVCDVDSNPANPVIGDRSFSRDKGVVAKHAVSFLVGMQSKGVIACSKHFPGHGDTSVDSHLALPVVEKELPDLQETELFPFRITIAAQVGMVMVAHVVFPALDEDNPASLSRAVQHDLLRQQMKYDGVIISDDLEMKAVMGRYPLEVQLDRACRATTDLLCISHDVSYAVEAWETLIRLQEADKVHDDLAMDSVKRLNRLRTRFFLNAPAQPPLSVVGSAAHKALAARFRAEGMV